MTTLGSRDAPRAARRAVADCCADAHAGPVCVESSAVMTSEIVTNAVLHGNGPVSFGVDCSGPHVRVEVCDDGLGRPTIRSTAPDGLGGRGMVIVESLASSWGVTDTPSGGKTVWFEVPVRP